MKALIYLVFIGAIITLGIMVGRGNPLPQPTPTTTEVATPQPQLVGSASPAQGGSAPQGRLFFLSQSSGTSEIFSVNIVSKEKKLLLSDKNSKEKIKLASNVTRAGDSIVVLLGSPDDPAGQLVALKTDGSKTKTVLVDNFITTNPPVISPDKSQLALVSFSNAEPDFGFSVVLLSVDGKKKKTLTRDESGITHLAFSPDGKQLAFLKGAANNEIALVTLATGEVKTLYTMKDQLIEDYDWSPVGLLALTATPAGKKAANQSEVYLVDPTKKTVVQITKNSLLERSPRIAPDASGISFIEVKDAKDSTGAGEVVVTRPDGTDPANFGKATQLLGWVKE